MIDLSKMLPMVAKVMGLNDQQISNLRGAVDKAQSLMNNSESPLEALGSSGIDKSFLDKVKNGLNNPRYQYVLNLLGMDKNDAQSAIDEISSGMSNPSKINSSNGFNDDVEKYQRYL